MSKSAKPRILFPSSSGGHLAELTQLKKLFASSEYLIVTEDIPLNRTLLQGKNARFIRESRKTLDFQFWKAFFINWFLAFKIILQFKPKAIVTVGGHVAVPFCYIGKIFGCKIVYIVTFARVDSKAKSADLVYPISDLFFVQWEQMKTQYPKASFVGSLY